MVSQASSLPSSSASPPVAPLIPTAALPPLSKSDFRAFNSFAERMDRFHSHFRSQWQVLQTASKTQHLPARTSQRQLLNLGLTFCSQLEMHHNIEESYVFPVLGQRMAHFSHGKQAGEMVAQHVLIHKGLVGLQEWLVDVRDEEKQFSFEALEEKMDVFGEVLFQHLDEEVRNLGAEEMRRFWSLKEFRELPFVSL
ncbi:MAG: hypothetical protein M1814_003366 [Vezdaea aestivalis]|nr:MAG: hypothetical protein M1814_003366 [Vezdaea aestivalis]